MQPSLYVGNGGDPGSNPGRGVFLNPQTYKPQNLMEYITNVLVSLEQVKMFRMTYAQEIFLENYFVNCHY